MDQYSRPEFSGFQAGTVQSYIDRTEVCKKNDVFIRECCHRVSLLPAGL